MPVLCFLGGAVLLAALAARLVIAWTGRFAPEVVFCPFRALTGLPCLTCGGTRALAALASGRITEAVALNPLVALTAAGLITLALIDATRRLARRPPLRWLPAGRKVLLLRGLALLSVAGNWVYLLARS